MTTTSPIASTKSLFARLSVLALVTLPLAPPASPPLYMPRSVARAFRNGTRSMDGRPGPKYWQNRGRYSITVTAMPPDRTINGSEQITYFNNSPDTLKAPGMKLLVNIHKPGAPRMFGASAAYLTSGVHIDAFAVNGKPAKWNDDPSVFTTTHVPLPAPVMPHDSVHLSIDWHYDLSREAGREGMLDSTTYFLAYFYPRIAVYDDYDGWDDMTFTDRQEFYSDFNDYDVTVRAPANYVVWGTGTLLDPAEVLQPEVAQRLQSSLTANDVIHVASKADFGAKRVTLATPVNSWHFRASDIPDMTFALSDHYDWDAASVIVDDATHRRASVQAAYNDSAADFHFMVKFGQHALDYFSHHWPGVPYPYEKTTIVQGGADMEYPMMVNDGSNADSAISRFVAEHEIAHTYMPFYMGINETRYGFMDEGWATTFEYLVGGSDVPQAKADSFYEDFRVNSWISDPSPLEDLPIITPEDVLTGVAYGHNAYGKASLGYLAVKDLLGDALFKKSLQAYMDRWHGKHPTPWDFFNSMNDVSSQNLNWFWNDWFFSNHYIDLAIKSATKSDDGYSVVLENIGGMAAPVDIVASFADGSTQRFHESSAIWRANLARATVRLVSHKTLSSLALDHRIWLDADTTNDGWRAKGR
ncbi:MAG: M1 family metallopeptidase [Gemmatimonadota bacterium]|nr:M1 family metallopeptidase [Gemmatimonadota bacterium]